MTSPIQVHGYFDLEATECSVKLCVALVLCQAKVLITEELEGESSFLRVHQNVIVGQLGFKS